MAGYMGKRQAADEITTVIKETDDDSPNTRTTTIKRAPDGEGTRAKSGAAGLLGLLNSYLSGGNASEEDDIWAAQNGAPSGAGMNSFIPWQSSPNERSDIGVGRSQFPRVGELDPPQPAPVDSFIPWQSSPNERSDIGVGRSQFPRVGELDPPQPAAPSIFDRLGEVNGSGPSVPWQSSPNERSDIGIGSDMNPFVPWERSPNEKSDIGIESPASDRDRRGRPPSLTEVLFPSTDTTSVLDKNIPWEPSPNERSDIGAGRSIFDRLGEVNGSGPSVPWESSPNERSDIGMGSYMNPSVPWQSSPNEKSDIGMGAPSGAPWESSPNEKSDIGMGAPSGAPWESSPNEKSDIGIGSDTPSNTVKGAENSVVEQAEDDQASYTVGGQQPSMAQTDTLTRTWGKLAYDPKKRRDEYMKRLNKIYANTMALEALAIVSGKRSRAGMYSKMAMGKLDAMQKFDSEDRLQQLSNALYFDRNGEYAPPADKAQAHSALMQMGATLNEATAIVGHVPAAVLQDNKTFYKYDPKTDSVIARGAPSKSAPDGWGSNDWAQKVAANKRGVDGSSDTGVDVANAQHLVTQKAILDGLPQGSPEYKQQLAYVDTLESLLNQSGPDAMELFHKYYGAAVKEGDPPPKIDGPDGRKIKFGSWEEFTRWWTDPNNTSRQSFNYSTGNVPGAEGVGATATAAVNADNPPVINSQEEYDALQPGTTYIDSNGTKATKP